MSQLHKKYKNATRQWMVHEFSPFTLLVTPFQMNWNQVDERYDAVVRQMTTTQSLHLPGPSHPADGPIGIPSAD